MKFYETFYGQRISDYGRKNGKVDYFALRSAFDAVLNNEILSLCAEDWEQIHGFVDNSEEVEKLEEKLEELEDAESNADELLSHLESITDALDDLESCANWGYFSVSFDGHAEDIELNACDLEIYDNYIVQNLIDGARAEIENFKEQIENRRELIEAYKETLEDESLTCDELYQYYIISERGKEILTDCTNEVVFYNEKLGMYLWGIGHWGTSWDYVLTDIDCETYEETEARKKAEAEAMSEAGSGSDASEALEEPQTENPSEEAENTPESNNQLLTDGFEESIKTYLDSVKNSYSETELAELERLLRHDYKAGDRVSTRCGDSATGVVLSVNGNTVTFLDGEEAMLSNRFDLDSFYDGELLITPCTDADYFAHRRFLEGWTEAEVDEFLRLYRHDFKKGDIVISNDNEPVSRMESLTFELPTLCEVYAMGAQEELYKLMVVDAPNAVDVVASFDNGCGEVSQICECSKLVDCACFDGIFKHGADSYSTNAIDW